MRWQLNGMPYATHLANPLFDALTFVGKAGNAGNYPEEKPWICAI